MLSDPSYNAQMGAAELGDVLESYRGSYICRSWPTTPAAAA
jgi:soluble lytic murein transglycosylase